MPPVPLSHRSKLIHDIRSLSGIDLTKLKLNVAVTICGVLLSAASTGAVLSWQAGSKWASFESAQAERDKKIAVALGKVETHDTELTAMKVRQESFDRYCCASMQHIGLFDAMTLATIRPQAAR